MLPFLLESVFYCFSTRKPEAGFFRIPFFAPFSTGAKYSYRVCSGILQISKTGV